MRHTRQREKNRHTYRERERQYGPYSGKKQSAETTPKDALTLALQEKECSKKLKETTSKRLSVTTVSHQAQTTDREYKKELNKNSRTKKYSYGNDKFTGNITQHI